MKEDLIKNAKRIEKEISTRKPGASLFWNAYTTVEEIVGYNEACGLRFNINDGFIM